MIDRTPQQEKLLVGMIAAFALRGHTVHELADGGFLICRWGLSKYCACLSELQAAGRQMGVTA